MAKIYFDKNTDLTPLQGKTIGVIGYGNQGRAQALNIRDSGLTVHVGNRPDAYRKLAQRDGLSVLTIPQAVKRADLLIIALPDEVQELIYERQIRSYLRAGQVLDFASGYGIRFQCVRPPKDVDVVMVSPRAMGVTVRDTFTQGKGVPAFFAVDQNVSGKAREYALAIAKAIGCTRAGVIQCTFEQESDTNLLCEQGVWPLLLQALLLGFEVLVEEGIPPEVAALDLYASGEAGEILLQKALEGFFKEARFHSPTSQYGELSRAHTLPNQAMKKRMKEVLRSVRSGKFAREWAQEQARGYPHFKELKKRAAQHPVNKVEKRVQSMVQGYLGAHRVG
jgi:ketol-acid reductoisomerase